MIALGRKLYGTEGSSSGLKIKPAILIVDEDQHFLQQVANLTKIAEYCVGDVVTIARRKRSAEYPWRLESARGSLENPDERSFLHGHRAGQDCIDGRDAAAELRVGRMFRIEIEQLQFPMRGHQRGECEKSQRRERGLCADRRHHMAEAPERAIGTLGVE